MTIKKMSAFEAMSQAQMIAFYPIVFQAVIAAKRLGILKFLDKNKGYNKIQDLGVQLIVLLVLVLNHSCFKNYFRFVLN
jgi:hypothetical protein